MALKMELVYEELKQWGELMITTSGGSEFEIHIGDTTFDFNARTITLKSSNAQYVIDGDSIESIEKHYGHKMAEGGSNGDD